MLGYNLFVCWLVFYFVHSSNTVLCLSFFSSSFFSVVWFISLRYFYVELLFTTEKKVWHMKRTHDTRSGEKAANIKRHSLVHRSGLVCLDVCNNSCQFKRHLLASKFTTHWILDEILQGMLNSLLVKVCKIQTSLVFWLITNEEKWRERKFHCS